MPIRWTQIWNIMLYMQCIFFPCLCPLLVSVGKKKDSNWKKNVRYLVARPGSPSTSVAAAALFASAANWYTISKQSRQSWTMRRQHAISRLVTASVLLLKIISHEFLCHIMNSLWLVTEKESDFFTFHDFLLIRVNNISWGSNHILPDEYMLYRNG